MNMDGITDFFNVKIASFTVMWPKSFGHSFVTFPFFTHDLILEMHFTPGYTSLARIP